MLHLLWPAYRNQNSIGKIGNFVVVCCVCVSVLRCDVLCKLKQLSILFDYIRSIHVTVAATVIVCVFSVCLVYLVVDYDSSSGGVGDGAYFHSISFSVALHFRLKFVDLFTSLSFA